MNLTHRFPVRSPFNRPRAKPIRVRRKSISVEFLEARELLATFSLGPLTFSGPNLASTNNVVTGTGVDVGFTPIGAEAFKPLVSTPGTVTFTQGTNTPTFAIDGDVVANVPVINKSFTLLSGHHDFDVTALVNSGLTELDGKAITVAGATFTLGSVRLESPSDTSTSAARIDLQGSLVIAQLAGLNLTVNGANQVIIDTSTGVSLSGLSASVTSPFTAFGVTVTPSPNVEVDYTSATQTFAISGGVSVAASGNTIAASLGTPATPGLQVVNGSVTAINFGVTTDFTLFGLSIHPTALTFAYDSAKSEYDVSGGIVVNTSGNSIAASLGTQAAPGLVIQNGAITSVNAGITTNFTLFGLSVQPTGLSLAYDAAKSQYEVYGGLSVATSGNTIAADLGTQAAPGLLIQSGAVSSVTFGLTGSFTLFGAAIQPNGLTFAYDATNAQYDIYGGLKVTASSNTINATLGTQAAPGMTIKSGSITAVNASVSANFSLFGMMIQPSGLALAYDSKNSQFEVYGNLAFSASGNTVNAALGTQSAPGLLIQNGAITSVNMGVTGRFNLFGLSIQPTNLTVTYDSKSSQYDLYGSLSVTTSNQSIAASLGTAQQPGLLIKSGSIKSVNLGLTADMHLFGVTIAANGLTFVYDSKDSEYEIFGNTSATFASNTINVSLGTSTKPGLVIKGGALTSLVMGVTANFTLFGVTIQPTNLTFSYDAAHSQYEIYGTLAVLSSSQSITANLGTASNPGLVIQNGTVQNVNFGVTANLTLFGVTIQPNGLTFVYDAKTSQYEMYGSLTVVASGQSITATLGTAAQPGLDIKNGAITGVNMSVTANLSLFGVTIQPSNLTFVYDSQTSQYEIYGGLTVMASGQSITATLGTAAQPGLDIKNGAITGVNMSVTANLSLFGLTLMPTDLTFVYDAANSQYEIYGDLTVSVSSQTVTANLGTQALPGLVIQNGSITNVNMGVSSDLNIAGVMIHAVDLGVIYSAANHSYGLYGAITVTNIFSASASFGTPQAPGITITNGKFVVSNLQLSLSDVTLGAFTLKNLSVSYTTDNQSNVTFEASATVAMPDGISVGGSIKFINGQIDSIALLVTGAKIPIGDTGVYIDSLGASVTGLSSGPSYDQLQVSGYASFYFGPSLSINGETAQLLRVDGSLTVNKTSLNVTVGIYLGALSTGTTKNVGYGLNVPNYSGLVAQGTGTLNVNWSTGVATVTANVSVLDGAATFNGAVVLDGPSLSIGIRATASVQVPSGVPVVGGLSLGSGNFALVYDGSTNTGYAAAWGSYTITVGGGHHCVYDHHGCWTDPSVSTSFSGGFKFTIGSNSLSFIHGSDLTNLDNATQVIFNGHIPGVNLKADADLVGEAADLGLPLPDVQANGSATDANNTFTLTSGSDQSGSVYTSSTQPFANGFDSTFQFSLAPNSEGVAFVVQAAGADSLGGSGPLLGFDGAIGQGLAVKFDSHDDAATDDPNGNFVSVDVAQSAAINTIASNREPGVNLADGKLHTAEVKYAPSPNGNGWGTLTVYLDGSQPVLSTVMPLGSDLGADSGGDGSTAYFGFSSSTSADVTGSAVVSNWSLTNVTAAPAPNPTAYPGFSDATNLSYAGAAALSGDSVDLTPKTAANAVGSLWTQTPLDLSAPFQETIQERTTPGGTGGFALVFQNDFAGDSAVGGAGAGLGVNGISNAVAIGFADGVNPADPSLGTQSVAVYTSPDGVVRTDAAHLAAETTDLPVTLNDGELHTLIVVFDPTDDNRLSVYMEGSVAPVLSVTGVNLAAALGGTTGFAGFTGSSGDLGQTTELVDWFHVSGVAVVPAPPDATPPVSGASTLRSVALASTVRVPSGSAALVAISPPVGSTADLVAPPTTVAPSPVETPTSGANPQPAQTLPSPVLSGPSTVLVPQSGHGASSARKHGVVHPVKFSTPHPRGPRAIVTHAPQTSHLARAHGR